MKPRNFAVTWLLCAAVTVILVFGAMVARADNGEHMPPPETDRACALTEDRILEIMVREGMTREEVWALCWCCEDYPRQCGCNPRCEPSH